MFDSEDRFILAAMGMVFAFFLIIICLIAVSEAHFASVIAEMVKAGADPLAAAAALK